MEERGRVWMSQPAIVLHPSAPLPLALLAAAAAAAVGDPHSHIYPAFGWRLKLMRSASGSSQGDLSATPCSSFTTGVKARLQACAIRNMRGRRVGGMRAAAGPHRRSSTVGGQIAAPRQHPNPAGDPLKRGSICSAAQNMNGKHPHHGNQVLETVQRGAAARRQHRGQRGQRLAVADVERAVPHLLGGVPPGARRLGLRRAAV